MGTRGHSSRDDSWDVVIVGSGAGGGALALGLARAGLRVLVLEKGPRHTRSDYEHGPDGLAPGDFVPPLDQEPHTVVTRTTREPLRTQLGWIATCVGGGTVHMGGYLYRFHPEDFRMAARFGPVADDDGEPLELADWPWDYDHLEPFYVQAEREIGVAGRGGCHPFEGPRSADYPLEPLRAHPVAAPLEEALRRRGLHPFPTPRSINPVPYGGRPACAYCRVCASYGCPVGARGTSQEAFLPRAEATGRCEVRPGSMVKAVTLAPRGRDRDARVAGCVYLDRDGREHEVGARVVCVAASAVESARLLLLSTSSRFPDGLGNPHGLVGRHLQFHAVTMGHGVFPLDRSPGDLLRDPHPFVGRSVMDHYFLPEGVSTPAKGGILRFGRAPQVPETPPPGDAHEDAPGESPGVGVLYFEGFHDFLPNRHTFVTLDPAVRDRWGLPVARIHLDRPGHHGRAGRFLAERAFEVLTDLGAVHRAASDVGGTSSYLVHGTCRAGNEAATSVLDPHCRVHGVANLFVVDGSFMPTSGGAPPTLTIVANALRVAAVIAERFG